MVCFIRFFISFVPFHSYVSDDPNPIGNVITFPIKLFYSISTN